MNCPNCNSIYVVNDMYGNHDKSSGNLIVVFGYVCDDCDHEWQDIKAVDWRD
jgi:transposase-like protein